MFIKDNSFKIKAVKDETTGFLTAPVTLSRTGVQHYYGFELGLKDRMMERIGVLRKEDEVFDTSSVSTFTNLVATYKHPSEAVTVDNVKKLQVGMVSGVKASDDGKTLQGVITITDKKVIKKIVDGTIEVSVGYKQDLKEEKGTYDGKEYEFIQTKIRANHLAIVDAGRCGPACKITIDSKKEFNMVITIDGIQYEVEDAQLAQAIQKQQDAFKKKEDIMKKKLDEEEEEKKKAKEQKDQLQATLDAMEKDKLTDDALSALISDGVELVVKAKAILGDDMPSCMNCPKEIKLAVADHAFPDIKTEDKTDAYIDALFDMAVEKTAKAKKTVANLSNDFKVDKKTVEDSREEARQGYIKDQLKVGSE